MARKSRAVFLDRDGTISRDVPYCSKPEDLELLPLAGEAIRLLNQHGFKVVAITNQSGIARGYFTEETLHQIHEKMCNDLAIAGASVDAIYYCPHHPEDQCECRKPKPTMVFRAALELNLDLSGSCVIGDQMQDIEMGRRAGCLTVLISGQAPNSEDLSRMEPNYIAANLHQAVLWVLDKVKNK